MIYLHDHKKKLIRIHFHDQVLYLDGRGCLFWPKNRALIVSDLHLGKARAFDAYHFNLPDYETDETLHQLEKLCQDYQPSSLILLGDSFHNTQSWSHLSPEQRKKTLTLTQAIPHCIWILGNHDPEIPKELPGKRLNHLSLPPLHLTHDNDAIISRESSAQILGHFHPKASIQLGRKKLRTKCFVVCKNHLICPSFGFFTGGLDIESEDFKEHFHTEALFLCHNEKIWHTSPR